MVKKLVKLGVVFALSISFLCYNAVPTYAAYKTDTWNLRYVKGGIFLRRLLLRKMGIALIIQKELLNINFR